MKFSEPKWAEELHYVNIQQNMLSWNLTNNAKFMASSFMRFYKEMFIIYWNTVPKIKIMQIQCD